MVAVPECLSDQFPHFDLSCLTAKQLDVLEMRYCGGLSWRKIAAFEGCCQTAIRYRNRRALRTITRHARGRFGL